MEFAFPTTAKGIATLLARIAFGATLLLVGIAQYQTFSAFQGMVTEGLGALELLGILWAYILPGLMILGGGLLMLGLFLPVGAALAGVALASIPVGLVLKSVLTAVPLPTVMPMIIDALIFLVVLVLVARTGACCQEKKK